MGPDFVDQFPARGQLRRSHPQGREGRPTCRWQAPTKYELVINSQDREGPRFHRTDVPCSRAAADQGDRMTDYFLLVARNGTYRVRKVMSAFRGAKAENMCSH